MVLEALKVDFCVMYIDQTSESSSPHDDTGLWA